MEVTKKWYRSKGVWLGVCTFLIGAIEAVQQFVQSGDFSTLAILTAAAGIGKVAERVIRTSDQIVM